MNLNWKERDGYEEAMLGTPDDGVTFTLSHHPTCYRRGPWRLLIEVCGGPNHYKWGCFDEQDQPLRYYHGYSRAKGEALRIAEVLWADRCKEGSVVCAEPAGER